MEPLAWQPPVPAAPGSSGFSFPYLFAPKNMRDEAEITDGRCAAIPGRAPRSMKLIRSRRSQLAESGNHRRD